jgi:hypothetical protein
VVGESKSDRAVGVRGVNTAPGGVAIEGDGAIGGKFTGQIAGEFHGDVNVTGEVQITGDLTLIFDNGKESYTLKNLIDDVRKLQSK